jgi:beta-glucanase (GH16 family)
VRAAALNTSRLLAAGMGILLTATVIGCSSGTGTQGNAGAASGAPSGAASAPASPPSATILGARWTQVWTDTFNGPAGQGINTANWQYSTGHNVFGTGEVETATNSPANVHLDGSGNLDIIPLNQGSSWTSGRLQTTRDDFAAPAGGEMLVTASIKQPDPAVGTGYWPGFWLIGPGTWPEHGEIDIMEDVNASNQVGGTMHCGNLTQRNADGTTGPCHENTGLSSGLLSCSACDTSYHTYSLIIDRRNESDQQVRWYVDGREFFSVSESRVGQAAWTEAIDHGFSIILDIAIGGGYPDVICHCTSPTSQTSSGAEMGVGYVSVYTN